MNLSSMAPRQVVHSLLMRAGEHASVGEVSHADSFYSAAIAADSGPTALLAYGCFLAELGELDDAERQLLQGWELSKQQHCPLGRAWACHALAVVFRERSDSLAARQYQQLAIAAELETEAFLDEGMISEPNRIGMAVDWMLSGELQSAKSLLRTTLDAREALADGTSSVTARLNLGLLSLCERDLDVAHHWFRAAFDCAREQQDECGMSYALELSARTLRQQGHWEAAVEALRVANQLARCMGQRHRVKRLAQQITHLERGLARINADPQLN